MCLNGEQQPVEPSLKEARLAFEIEYFKGLVERHGSRISTLSKISGIDRTHLYRKLRDLGFVFGETLTPPAKAKPEEPWRGIEHEQREYFADYGVFNK